MAGFFEYLRKNFLSGKMFASDPELSHGEVQRMERYAKKAQERVDKRKKFGIDNRSTSFWNVDSNAIKRYKTENPLAVEEIKKKYSDITDPEVDDVISNRIKRDILKRSTHPKVKELYNAMFDKNGNFTSYGERNWDNVNNKLATIALENDIDGSSDDREQRKEKKWYQKYEDYYTDAFDPQVRTMRQAATKYLNDSENDAKNREEKNFIFKQLNTKEIDQFGKSSRQYAEEFDKYAQQLSQDYFIQQNPDLYADLSEYNRIKDTGKLKMSDEEKLDRYAQYIVDAERGGTKYANQRLAQYFVDKMHKEQTPVEMATRTYTKFRDNTYASLMQVGAILWQLSPTGMLLSKMGVDDAIAEKVGLYTEADKERRKNMSLWQNLIDNPIMQYADNVMETGVWDPKAQVRFLEEGLQDDALYRSVEQQDALLSTPQFLDLIGQYGFTAGMTIASFGTTGMAKLAVDGTMKSIRAIKGVKDAVTWTKNLRRAVQAKNWISTGLGAAVATAEGAGITLHDKRNSYQEGYEGFHNRYFAEEVAKDPVLAAAYLLDEGIDGVPEGTVKTNKNGEEYLDYSDEEKQQLADLIIQNSQQHPVLAKFKEDKVQQYIAEHGDDVAKDYANLQEMVEDATTANFLIQATINGFINHTLKSTLVSKSLQKSRKAVANTISRRTGIKAAKNTSKKSGLDDFVSISQGTDNLWKAEAKQMTKEAIFRERIKESLGEGLEEGLQDIASAFGEGFQNYAYQNYINSRFGDKDGVNTAVEYTVWDQLWAGLKSAALATVDDQTLLDAFYGFASSAIGGLNVNENLFTGEGKGLARWSPVKWRGAWTPLVFGSNEVNSRNRRNKAMADRINEFLSDKDVQEKLTSAGGIMSFINDYKKAIEAGDDFMSKNAKFGQIFSVANILEKLKGTAYHDMVTNSLDNRIAIGDENKTDDQIKKELEDPNSNTSQALKEYKNAIENHSENAAENIDFSPSDDNVQDVRQIAKNAKKLKDILDKISKARDQVQKDFGAELDNDGMDAFVYQQLSIENKEERIKEIDEKLQEISPFDKNKQSDNTSKRAIANYGSLENLRLERQQLQQSKESLEKTVAEEKKDIEAIRKKIQKYDKALKANDGKSTEAIEEMKPDIKDLMKVANHEKAKRYISQIESTLKSMDKQDKALSKSVEKHINEKKSEEETDSTTPVLSEREIMEMDAASRAYMLNEENKKQYSQAQQAVIDAINTKGRQKHGKDWDVYIQDAARLEQQLSQDQIQLNRILSDSKVLANYINAAKTAKVRRRKIRQYEHLFTDAETAMLNYDEEDSESVAVRDKALADLADFLNSPSEDSATRVAKQDLRSMYSNSRAMELVDQLRKSLDSFNEDISRIDLVEQEETQQMDGSPVNLSEDEPTKKVIRDRQISADDRNLLDYAVAYAASHMVPLDDLPDAIDTQDFRDFVQQQNDKYQNAGKSVKVELEKLITPEGIEDARRFLRAAIKFHKEANEARERDAAVKQAKKEAVRPAKSEAPKPLAHEQSASSETPQPKPAEEPSEEGKKDEIPEDLQVGVDNLLDEIEVLDFSDVIPDEAKQRDMREELKSAVMELVTGERKFNNIKEIQNALVSKFDNHFVKRDIAVRLRAVSISSRERKRKQDEGPKIVPFELETADISRFPNDPTSVWGGYISSHKIMDNHKRVTDKMYEMKVQGKTESVHVMFMFDPTLAKAVETSMGSKYNQSQVPIILVIPVNSHTRELFGIKDTEEGGDDGLIYVGDNNFKRNGEEGGNNFEETLYMPIGIMPADNNDNVDSSSRMRAVRDLLDTGVALGKTKLGENSDIDNSDLPRVLRYRTGKTYSQGQPKEGGTRVSADISSITAIDNPKGDRTIEPSSLVQLGLDNVSDSKESIVEGITKEKRQEFEEAKSTGDMRTIRATKLYRDIRDAIRKRLFPEAEDAEESDEEDNSNGRTTLRYDVRKGTRGIKGTKGGVTPIVMTKPIEETPHRDNPERTIGQIIQEYSDTNDTSEELIGADNGKKKYRGAPASARMQGLFFALSRLFDTANEKNRQYEEAGQKTRLDDAVSIGWPIEQGWFDEDGVLRKDQTNSYESAMEEFGKLFMKKLGSYIHIADKPQINISLDQSNPVGQKTMTIEIKKDGKKIAGITLKQGEEFKGSHLVSLLQQLMYEKRDGKFTLRLSKRRGKNGKRFGLIKWQVNYRGAGSDRSVDVDTYNDLFDDGVLEMRLDKLAYKPKSIKLNISPMKQLYNSPEPQVRPQAPAAPKTETKTADGATVDGDSGVVTKSANIATGTAESTGIPETLFNKLKNLLEKSKARVLNKEQNGYEIDGMTWARVTSVKRFFPDSKSEKFNEKSPWKLPSTSVGNSLDGFGRDVLNGTYDGTKEEDRMKDFDGYPNSTAKNYNEVYKSLKKIQANLAEKGQTILAIGDADNPGEIVVRGSVPVKLGNIYFDLRIAGTLDALAIDDNGDLHIYDFKTYHGEELNENTSQEKDHHAQLSLYAKFLEEETGLKVASINIIPVKVSYPTPEGAVGGDTEYKKEDEKSQQLLIKKRSDQEFSLFKEAAFKVGEPYQITRIEGDALTIETARLMQEDHEEIVEMLARQTDLPVTKEDLAAPVEEETPGGQTTDKNQGEPESINDRIAIRSSAERNGEETGDNALFGAGSNLFMKSRDPRSITRAEDRNQHKVADRLYLVENEDGSTVIAMGPVGRRGGAYAVYIWRKLTEDEKTKIIDMFSDGIPSYGEDAAFAEQIDRILHDNDSPEFAERNTTSPDQMTDDEIDSELAKLSDNPDYTDRINELKAERESRNDQYQELRNQYPIGAQVNSDDYGDGTVTAHRFDNGYEGIVVDYNGTSIWYNLHNPEYLPQVVISDETIDVITEEPQGKEPKQAAEPGGLNAYDEGGFNQGYDPDYDEDGDDDASFFDPSDFGATPGSLDTIDTVKQLTEDTGEKTAEEQQEDNCKLP